MGADRTGCARRRPVLGEELAALQRSEDIAQSDVARRPRQFEAAARDRAERGSIPLLSSARRGGEPRPDWCWRYPPHPPNAGPCQDWRPAPSANERQRQIGCSFPSREPLRMTRPRLQSRPAAAPVGVPAATAGVERPSDHYFGHGGNPGLPHASGCATGGGLEPPAAADEGAGGGRRWRRRGGGA